MPPPPPPSRDLPERRLIILGSTGSIGVQTLDVVEHLNREADAGRFPFRYRVVGLAAGRRAEVVRTQAQHLGVTEIALADPAGASVFGDDANVRTGADAPERLVREVECDLVMGAMVGFAGLAATLASVELGIDVALANKETLVAGGSVITKACARTGARLLPVDSEHAAIWQALQGPHAQPHGADPLCPPCTPPSSVRRVILTASGGAFRDKPAREVYDATPEQALAHPTWDMGPKVTIDCASLTNKALEVIEAHWLFGLSADQLGVLIHRQSTVHSLVEYADGNLLAQLGVNDMRIPIQYTLTFPDRAPGTTKPLDLASLARLDFEEPDLERFPALGAAWRVIELGGSAGATFNGANERAVEAFLTGAIPFGRIPELSLGALDALGASELSSLADAIEADRAARAWVDARLDAQTTPAH